MIAIFNKKIFTIDFLIYLRKFKLTIFYLKIWYIPGEHNVAELGWIHSEK